MGAALPDIPLDAFEGAVDRLRERATEDLDLPVDLPVALARHYGELQRWNRGTSLVGPGTAAEVVRRHYEESLAAVPWLPRQGTLVDVGSGAGFPGVVLAAARPGLQVVLVEPRQRKWAFLEASRRVTGLSFHCLDARVARPLPAGLPAEIDIVTSRALRLSPEILDPLYERSPRLRWLLWQGEADPQLPRGLRVTRESPLPGGERRRLLEIVSA